MKHFQLLEYFATSSASPKEAVGEVVGVNLQYMPNLDVGSMRISLPLVRFVVDDSCHMEEPCRVMVFKQKGKIIPPWLSDFEKRLEEVKNLGGDWNGYGSRPPNAMAIWNARDILGILHEINLVPSQIGPSAEGGVDISFVTGNKYAIIEFYNDGEILASIFEPQGDPVIWEIGTSNRAIKEALSTISSHLNA